MSALRPFNTCMELLLGRLRAMQAPKMAEKEIPADKLAAFLDGRLSDEERAGIEARLAADPDARAEMIAVSRLMDEASRPITKPRRNWKPVGIAAVAAVALFALVLIPRDRVRQSGILVPAERLPGAEDGGRVSLLSPEETVPVATADLVFSWGAEGNASYRVTVANAEGATIWTAVTTATRITLPASIRLNPGGRYSWYVDAMLIDGSSITSGPRAFTVLDR